MGLLVGQGMKSEFLQDRSWLGEVMSEVCPPTDRRSADRCVAVAVFGNEVLPTIGTLVLFRYAVLPVRPENFALRELTTHRRVFTADTGGARNPSEFRLPTTGDANS